MMIPRPLRWILLFLALLAVTLLSAAAYFKVWIFDRTPGGLVITPQRTRLPEPTYYQPDGMPDFVETMNQAAKKDITPGTNAAVDCLRALGPLESSPEHWAYLCDLMEFEPDETDASFEIPTKEAYRSASGNKELKQTLWSSEDFPVMSEFLDQNHEVLLKLREASKKPYFYLPLVPHPSGSMLEILLVHEQGMREIVRQITYDAIRAVEKGDYDYSIENAEAIFRFAKHLEAPPYIIVKSLIACAHKNQGLSLLQLIAIDIHNKRPADAKALLSRIKSIVDKNKEPTDLYTPMDQGERLEMVSTIMRMAYYGVQSQNVMDHVPPVNPTYLRSCDWSQIIDHGNELFDRILEPLKTDEYEKISVMNEELDQELKKIYGSKNPTEMMLAKFNRRLRTKMMEKVMLGLLLPAYNVLPNARVREVAQTRLTYATVLLAEYSIEHGSFPKELADLGLDMDSKWIIDPFTNGILQYESPSQNTQYSLYALGPNRIDNHGKPFGEIGADDVSPLLPDLNGTPIDLTEPE